MLGEREIDRKKMRFGRWKRQFRRIHRSCPISSCCSTLIISAQCPSQSLTSLSVWEIAHCESASVHIVFLALSFSLQFSDAWDCALIHLPFCTHKSYLWCCIMFHSWIFITFHLIVLDVLPKEGSFYLYIYTFRQCVRVLTANMASSDLEPEEP